jgi:ubiquinol-cytochrome c reductase cytochrome c1 subunit
MKELKVLFVVIVFTGITYYGVEPFAHHAMHKKVDANGQEVVYNHNGFTYPDLKVPAGIKGNAENGKALSAACVGCHSIKSQKMPAPMDALASAGAYGVNPPDLSNAGAIYDDAFLFELMKNPAHALKVEHKFDMAKGQMHPMPPMAGDDQSAADLVAYFKSIAPKAEEITPKEAYVAACGRCHADRYGKWTQIGDVPKTKANIITHQDPELMKFNIKVAEYQDKLSGYMGKLPPDLSIMIRARSEHFMENFIEDPQSELPGTAMPRVGLNKEGFEKVMAYLEETGDPSKPKREAIGPWVLGFFFIFTILAYLWKQSQWKDLH